MNNEQFEDAESISYNYMKDKVTFRDIILQHLRKICQLASVEFRGGYWEQKQVPGYNYTIDTYVPDSREAYSNAVECFADMLAPYFDKEVKDAEKKAIDEEKEIYGNHTVLKEPDREDKNSKEAKRYERKFPTTDVRMTYRTARVRINRKLFRALCSFLFRKKYLELGSIED